MDTYLDRLMDEYRLRGLFLENKFIMNVHFECKLISILRCVLSLFATVSPSHLLTLSLTYVTLLIDGFVKACLLFSVSANIDSLKASQSSPTISLFDMVEETENAEEEFDDDDEVADVADKAEEAFRNILVVPTPTPPVPEQILGKQISDDDAKDDIVDTFLQLVNGDMTKPVDIINTDVIAATTARKSLFEAGKSVESAAESKAEELGRFPDGRPAPSISLVRSEEEDIGIPAPEIYLGSAGKLAENASVPVSVVEATGKKIQNTF